METNRDLIDAHAIDRLFAGDHTLWAPEPTEISNRLEWLTEPTAIHSQLDRLSAFTDRVGSAGIEQVVWCGMGGSSLFPDLLARSALRAPDSIPFIVLDSSHPNAVLHAHEFADHAPTLFMVASKSGGTIETRSHLEYFWHHFANRAHFGVVTDAGSALDTFARTNNFFAMWNANPNIGGRYSALSHFGIVAAALLGLDLDLLLNGAIEQITACRENSVSNAAVNLAVAMAGHVREGRDKVVLDCHRGFAAWLEQLVAESTGKHGKGILPVPGDEHDAAGSDRVRISYGRGGDLDLGTDSIATDPAALGREIIRWEIATALAGAMLSINPFDQPDVEAAKLAAGRVLESEPANIDVVPLDAAIHELAPNAYVTLQAFVDPDGPIARDLEASRISIRDATSRSVSAAVGPRYLHSTGQLHKGGPATVRAIQILDSEVPELAIPGRAFSFGALLRAQADGDYAAMIASGKSVHRVTSLKNI